MSELKESADTLLASGTIDLSGNGTTDLYDVPTGKRCVLTRCIIVGSAAATTTTITIGQDGAETDFLTAQTLSNLDAAYDAVVLQPVPNATPVKQKSYAAATNIEAVVANADGGATSKYFLFGILY